MNPQVIAASVGVVTLIATVAAQIFGRRATSRDTQKAFKEQREQLNTTLVAQREQLDRTLAEQLAGPLLATATGGRLRQGHLWELVRRLARTAGIGAWEQLSYQR